MRSNQAQGLLVLSILFFLYGCSSPTESTEQEATAQEPKLPPTLPDACLFVPEFETDIGTIQAGTAFPVMLDDVPHPLLITALHLLGDAGGLEQEIAPTEVKERVRAITIFDLFQDDRYFEFEANAVEMPNSGLFNETSVNGDVVAFQLPSDNRVGTLEFASTLPQFKEPVWMAARVMAGAPSNQKLHQGTFLGIEEGHFVLRFDNPGLELQATSGAPILNADGQVVAINLGGGLDEGVLYGVGNPVTRFQDALREAAIRNAQE